MKKTLLIIITIIFQITSMNLIADEKIEIKNKEQLVELLGKLKKYIDMGNKLFDIDMNEWRKYQYIEWTLQDYFQHHPEVFETLDMSLFNNVKFLGNFKECEVRKTECVYLNLLMKCLKENPVNFYKAFSGFPETTCGCEHVLDVMLYYQNMPTYNFPNKDEVRVFYMLKKRIFNYYIPAARKQVKMYKEILSLKKDDVKDWKVYQVNLGKVRRRRLEKAKLKIAEMKKDFFPKELVSKKRSELTEKEMEKLGDLNDEFYDKTYPILDEAEFANSPITSEESTLTVAQKTKLLLSRIEQCRKSDWVETELDFFPILKLAGEQGGMSVEEDYAHNRILANVFFICDENDVIRYVFNFYIRPDGVQIQHFYLTQVLYDENKDPCYLVCAEIQLKYNETLKKMFLDAVHRIVEKSK